MLLRQDERARRVKNDDHVIGSTQGWTAKINESGVTTTDLRHIPKKVGALVDNRRLPTEWRQSEQSARAMIRFPGQEQFHLIFIILLVYNSVTLRTICASSWVTRSAWPKSTARSLGRFPVVVRARTEAPLASRSEMINECPPSTARCNAVSPV